MDKTLIAAPVAVVSGRPFVNLRLFCASVERPPQPSDHRSSDLVAAGAGRTPRVAVCTHRNEQIYPNGTPACAVDFDAWAA